MDFEFKTNLKNLMSEKSSGGMAHWWSLCLVVHEALAQFLGEGEGGSTPRNWHWGWYLLGTGWNMELQGFFAR